MNDLATSQIERSCSHQEALNLFQHEMNHLRWTLNEMKVGPEHGTHYTELFDSNGLPLQDGMGKGLGIQAILSSRFESLEHSITDLNSRLVQKIWSGSLIDAQVENFKFIPSSFPTEWMNDNKMNKKKSFWKIFKSSSDSHSYLFPLSKLDPFSNYLDLYPNDELYKTTNNLSSPWFKHNNGTAIGTSFNEAFIHGMNEAIERYSISCHYADCYLKLHPEAIKIVDINTIPRGLKKLIDSIWRHYQIHPTVFDITTELGVKTFAVKASRNRFENFIGYGTSLFSEYALERAILECQQMLHTSYHPIYGPQNTNDAIKVQEDLKDWPNLQSAVQLKFEGRDVQVIPFESIQKDHLSLEEQKVLLEKILKTHNIDFFTSIMYESLATPITLVRLIIPEFSNFSFIADGFPVTPSGRILKRLTGSL